MHASPAPPRQPSSTPCTRWKAARPRPSSFPTATARAVSLKALLGRGNLVLYFYPKDMTPGCTVEACELSRHAARLKALGAQVVGSQRRRAGVASQVHGQARAQLSAAERHRQPGHAALRRVQEEVALRARVHGNRAHHVRHRSRGRHSQGLSQGQGRGPRRRRGRGGSRRCADRASASWRTSPSARQSNAARRGADRLLLPASRFS